MDNLLSWDDIARLEVTNPERAQREAERLLEYEQAAQREEQRRARELATQRQIAQGVLAGDGVTSIRQAPQAAHRATPEPGAETSAPPTPRKAVIAPHAPPIDDVTMIEATVWDNWLGPIKPPVSRERKVSFSRFNLSLKIWTCDPTPINHLSALEQAVAWSGATELIDRTRFLKALPKLQSDGKISLEYHNLLQDVLADKPPSLCIGLLSANGSRIKHSGKAYFENQFVLFEVMNMKVQYAKLVIGGEVLSLEAFADTLPQDKPFKPRLDKATAKPIAQIVQQARIELTSKYGYVAWRSN